MGHIGKNSKLYAPSAPGAVPTLGPRFDKGPGSCRLAPMRGIAVNNTALNHMVAHLFANTT